MVKGAWVTLATNDSYSLGALVLAHSLKQVGTQQELAILVTPGVTNSMRAKLSDVFNIVKEVNVLDSKDKANLRLLQRPELGITFTKLHCWQLTEYEKCVFLDADTLVLQNCDELFEREELSAAPDVGWPDCFNSGVFVYRPSEETYNSLIQFALDKGSFDGGDQGLLNLYFADWARKDISKHLPFIYNVCSTAFYSYLPAFKQFGKDVKIIHFIGNAKPWLQYFDTESKRVRPSRDLGHLEPILQKWWNIFCSMIHPNLSPDMSGLAGAFAKLTLGQQRTPEQEALEDSLRRQNWEQGNIDYLGKDSFDNIWSKICETLAKGPPEDGGVQDLDIASSQQEKCAPLKEDVLAASQESPLKAELNLSTQSSTLPPENTPTDSVVAPKRELFPQETLSSITPKTSETSESKNVPTTQPVVSSVENIPPEILPSLPEAPKAATLPVEQTQSENLLPEKETVSLPTEKAISAETGLAVLESASLPSKQVESSSVIEGVAAPSEVPKQEIPTEQGTVPLSIPSPQQASPSNEGAKTQQVTQELSCPLKEAPPVESPACPIQAAPVKEASPKPSPPKEVQSCPIQATPVKEASSEPSPTEEIQSSPIPATPVKEVSSEPTPPKEVQSCPIQATPVKEASSKPSPPKEVQSSPIQAAHVKEASSKPSPPKEVQSCPIQAAPVKEVSSKPSPPKEVQSSPIQAAPVKVISSETSPPKEAQSSPIQAAPSPPKEVQSSPIQAAPAKEVYSKPSPPKEIQDCPIQPPSKEVSSEPSPPLKTAPKKSDQCPPKEVTQPSEEKIAPPTQIELQKVVPPTTGGPSTPTQQVLIPASADTSNTGAASPVVSSEVPPPIAPPPRKSGGNKKQGKSKK